MTNRCLEFICKDQNQLTLGPDATIQLACQRMWERRVCAVLVTRGGGVRPSGFSLDGTRCARSLTFLRPSPTRSPANATVNNALRHRMYYGHRYLPVVDDGRLLGIM